MAIQVLKHAFFMLMRNILPAMQISIAPIVLVIVAYQIGANYLQVGPLTFVSLAAAPARISNDLAMFVLLLVLLAVVMAAWIAVSWHRFVLLPEQPGFVPAFHGGAIGSYLWLSLQIGVLLMILSFIVGFVLAFLLAIFGLQGNALAEQVVGLLIVLIATHFSFRMSLALPARATGKAMKLSESWSVTEGYRKQIFQVAVGVTALNGFVGAVSGQLVAPFSTSGLYVQFAVQWATVMFGASILTTLYGLIVERRELES